MRNVKCKLLLAQLRLKERLKEFMVREEGDTNFVSIVLIIVIVIAVAMIFKDGLVKLAEGIFEKLSGFTGIDI